MKTDQRLHAARVSDAPPDCPGPNRCHESSWCPDCDVTSHGPCHVRAAGGHCDRHPSSAVASRHLNTLTDDLAAVDAEIATTETQRRRVALHLESLDARLAGRRLERRYIAAAMEQAQADLAAAQADESRGVR
ncbi:MAG: hypothetical protein JNL82_29740 [Myxococcales bacterium]|nr:hypothetical protein [Myxococcales bacterium]